MMTAAPAAVRDQAKVAVYHLNLDDRRAAGPAPTLRGDREWIEPLLQQNAVWFCQLRWIVVIVLGAAGLASLFPNALAQLHLAVSPWWPLGAALFLATLNSVFVRLIRTRGEMSRIPVKLLLWAQIVSDLLVLTAVIHWLGHAIPAAPFMYLFHIILACIVFSAGESLAVAGLAAAFYLLSLVAESLGLLSRKTVLIAPGLEIPATQAPAGFTVVSMLLVWIVIWYLGSRLAAALRSRDRELFISNLRLRASIEERSKHMLQTTHQLKAPFAAIHAQCQLLLGEYCGALPARARVTVERMSARCLVLARQIQEMLQLANLRSQGQMPPPTRAVNVGALIGEVLTRVEPAAHHRGVRFDTAIEPVTVEAVEDHLTMLIDNLVVNAVNYSFDNSVVDVTCDAQPSGDALITVRDRGIGIPEQKLPRIFDDYYRTEEAVQHNRGSTGLGLAIVRQVACKDRVPITVESAPGWGTRFTVVLPRAQIVVQNNPRNN